MECSSILTAARAPKQSPPLIAQHRAELATVGNKKQSLVVNASRTCGRLRRPDQAGCSPHHSIHGRAPR